MKSKEVNRGKRVRVGAVTDRLDSRDRLESSSNCRSISSSFIVNASMREYNPLSSIRMQENRKRILAFIKSPFVLATTEEMHYIMVPNPILIRNMRVTMNKLNDAVEIQEAIHKVAVLKVRYYQSRF